MFAHRLVCCYVALVDSMGRAVQNVSLETGGMLRDCLNLRNVRTAGTKRDPWDILVACRSRV